MSFSKTQQFLAYITKNRPRASITVLMKLSYLIDLVASKELGDKITGFNYVRYFYGPYDATINTDMQYLIENGIIIYENAYAAPDAEYTVYSFNTEKEGEFTFENLGHKEKNIINNVIADLGGYGAKTLTEIAYKTEPMIKLGATIGGTENFNETLVLV